MPGIGIAIVNYRTPGLAIECLRSVAEQAAPGLSVRAVLVENGSADGSAEALAGAIEREAWSWVSLLPLETNRGFAAGTNAALRVLLGAPEPPAYLLLLNPDTRLHAGALAALVARAAASPRTGIVGPRLEYADGTPQRNAFRFPSAAGELEAGLRLGVASRILARAVVAPPVPDAACRADWVAGACMLLRREVLERVGRLDEGFFLYYEEVDFCLRAARRGWRCWYEPASRVIHLRGQATGVTAPGAELRPRPGYWFESRRRYFVKSHGLAYAALADALWVAGHALWRVRRWATRRPASDPPRFLRDFVRHSVFFRGGVA